MENIIFKLFVSITKHAFLFQNKSLIIQGNVFIIMGKALFCCFCLLTNQCCGRHRVASPDIPDNYHFAQRIREPCGVPMNLMDSIGDESVLNMVHIVSHKIDITSIGEVRLIFLCIFLRDIM